MSESGRMPHVAIDEYVTGALSPDEQRAVEAHIFECDECRAELEATRRLHARLQAALDDEPGPSERVRRDVFAQIAARPQASSAGVAAPDVANVAGAPGAPGGRAGEPTNVVRPSRWSRAPSLPRWAQLAAVVLIVVQAALLIRPLTEPAVPPDQVVPRGVGQAALHLRVVFNPAATDAQIRDVLRTLGARVVDGPSASGAYRLELQGADPKTVAAAIAAARAQQDVLQSVDATP